MHMVHLLRLFITFRFILLGHEYFCSVADPDLNYFPISGFQLITRIRIRPFLQIIVITVKEVINIGAVDLFLVFDVCLSLEKGFL